jgi:hypothetical protein
MEGQQSLECDPWKDQQIPVMRRMLPVFEKPSKKRSITSI